MPKAVKKKPLIKTRLQVMFKVWYSPGEKHISWAHCGESYEASKLDEAREFAHAQGYAGILVKAV